MGLERVRRSFLLLRLMCFGSRWAGPVAPGPINSSSQQILEPAMENPLFCMENPLVDVQFAIVFSLNSGFHAADTAASVGVFAAIPFSRRACR